MSIAGNDQEDNGNGSCFPQNSPMKKIFRSKTNGKTTSSHLRLEDKVAIITGAASGIGAATARLFVSHGAKVIIADVNAAAGKKLSSELGSSAHFFPCDVTEEDSVAGAVDYAVSSWGHLDIMFNNAGVSGPLAGLADVLMEDLDKVMAVHVKGAVLGVKHAARVMIPAGKGVILLSGSTSAVLGGTGPPLHSAANGAVRCIVRSAAAELVHHGIRVNAVSPHCVATPMSIATFKKSVDSKTDITVEQFEKILAGTSELDVLTTDQVAHAVMFLASDEAGFISGHNLVMDGGFSVTKKFDSANLKVALQKSLAAERKAEGRSPTRALEASGINKVSKVSIEKDQVTEDKVRKEKERVREKEEKDAHRALAEKQKEKQEGKEREKREEERKFDEDKARAKEVKALAKDPKAAAVKHESHKNGEIIPMDKKAREKREKAAQEALAGKQKEKEREEKEMVKQEKKKKIEEDKVRAKKDKERAKEEKARAKEVKALAKEGQVLPVAAKNPALKDQSHLNGDLHQLDKKASAKEARIRNENIELPNAGPEPDIPIKFQSKPPVRNFSSLLRLGRNSSSKNPGEISKKEGKDDTSADLGKNSRKENKEDKPKSKAEKARTEEKDSPKAAASLEITSEPQPKPSPLSRIGELLRVDNTKKKGKAPKKENEDTKPTDPGKTSKKEAKTEKARKDSSKTAASPVITLESQPKVSLLSRIGDLLRGDTTKKKAISNVSQKEKKEDKPADTRKTSKKEAKAEEVRTKGNDSPKTAASPEITPEPQSKPSPLSRIGSPLSGDTTKKKEGSTDPGKVSQKGNNEAKPTVTGKTSEEEAKAEKARTKGNDSPKSAASPEITPEPQSKPSLLSRIGSPLSGDTTKKKEGSADPGKVSQKGKNEAKPTSTSKTTKNEAKAEKARTKGKDSLKTAASPEISSEPQQKPSLLSRIASLLRGNTTKKTDTSTDPGKVSAKEAKSKDSK